MPTVPTLSSSGGIFDQLTAGLTVGASKVLVERTMAPFVGNSNLMSAGAKIAAAMVAPKVLGGSEFSKNVALGIYADGFEDLALYLMNLTGLGAASSQSQPQVVTI